MEIFDDALLLAFRLGFRCEWCQRRCVVEPHHYWFRKGVGGGSQIDHPYNLIALCRLCHDLSHNGREPTKHQLIEMVALREKTTPGEIQRELQRIRALPKIGKALNPPEKRGPKRWRFRK